MEEYWLLKIYLATGDLMKELTNEVLRKVIEQTLALPGLLYTDVYLFIFIPVNYSILKCVNN